MKIEISFNQDKQCWEILSPAGVILENLNFHFPVDWVDGQDGVTSYPAGKPIVTATGRINGEKFKTQSVSIRK